MSSWFGPQDSRQSTDEHLTKKQQFFVILQLSLLQDGRTACQLAEINGHSDIVQLLKALSVVRDRNSYLPRAALIIFDGLRIIERYLWNNFFQPNNPFDELN